MAGEPASRNYIPIPLQSLSLKELHILTGISLYKLEGFAGGEFRPNPANREKLSVISLPFYAWNKQEKELFVQRKKYRAIMPFITEGERDELASDSAKYAQRLNVLVNRHWHEIMKRIAEKFT